MTNDEQMDAEHTAWAECRRLAAELAAVAGPVWIWGDGYGGTVMHEVWKACEDAGLPMFEYDGNDRHTHMAAVRRSLNKAKVKAVLLERDGDLCQACWADDDLQIDHKIPVSRGGTNSLTNLHLLCASCNTAKGTMRWHDYVCRLETLAAETRVLA